MINALSEYWAEIAIVISCVACVVNVATILYINRKDEGEPYPSGNWEEFQNYCKADVEPLLNLPARQRLRISKCELCLKGVGDEYCVNCQTGVVHTEKAAMSITRKQYCECEERHCAMCNPGWNGTP